MRVFLGFSFINFKAYNAAVDDGDEWWKLVYNQASTAANANLEKIGINERVIYGFCLNLKIRIIKLWKVWKIYLQNWHLSLRVWCLTPIKILREISGSSSSKPLSASWRRFWRLWVLPPAWLHSDKVIGQKPRKPFLCGWGYRLLW